MTPEQKTLLLVEDDTLLAMTESHWLRKAGYKIIHVVTGEEAIQLVKIKKDQIDLILMDINLGNGIDGTKAGQEILKVKDIPLLFLSSHTEKEIVEKTEQITSYGYVVKDSNDVVLLASIKMAFKLYDANTRLVAQTKALHFSEEKFSKAFYTSPDSVTINRLSDGVFFEINDGFTNLTGFTAEEVIGRSSLPDDLNVWIDIEDRNKLIQGLNEHGEVNNLEAKFRFKDGTVHVGLLSARIIEIDEEKYILSITRDITDRKQTEEILGINEEKYRLLLELAPDSFFQGDHSGNFITVNNKASDLTGYTKEELLTMNMTDIFPTDIIREKPLRYDLLELGETIRMEREVLRKNGRRVRVEMNSKKMPDGTYQSFIRDISERIRTEKSLGESEKKYRDLFEKSEDAILIIENGKFVDCNNATVKMLRYNSKEDLLVTHPSELSPEKQPDGRSSYQKANEMMSIALEKGSHRFEWWHKKADNEIFDVEVLLTAISTSENIEILHTVWRDITERKRAEKALREGEERYRTLFDLSPSGIMLLDTQGNIINVNSAACKSTNFSKEEILGQNIRMLVGSQYLSQINSHIERLLAGETLEHEVVNIPKDGTPKTIELRESLISLQDGSKGIISISNDITERKIIEEKLKSSEIFYRQLIESTGAVAFQLIYGETFGTGYYKFIGKEIENIIGIKPSDIDEKTVNAMTIKIIPLSSDMPIDPIECRNRILNGNLEQFNADILVQSITGELKWLNHSSLPIWDESHSKVIGAMGILIDISERKFAEETLKKSEEKFRNLIERIPDAVYKSTHEGKFLEVNPALVQMLGYRNEEELKAIDIKNDLYFEIADRESAALIEKYEEMAIFRLRKKDGSEIWVEDHGRHVLDNDGNILYHEGIMRDVTERIRAEEELLQRQYLMNSLMNTSTDNIYFKDRDSRFIQINKAMANFLKLKSDEDALGKTDFDFFAEEHARLAFEDEQKIIETGLPIIGHEEKEFWQDGHVTWVFTSKFPLRDKDGKIIGTFGVSRDISELKSVNLQLYQYAEELKTANAAKDKFFSIIAHDLKNPFHSINSALKLILNKEEVLTEEERENFLNSVLNTSEKAYSLLENLLLWARSQMKSLDFKTEKIEIYEAVIQNTELLKNSAMLKNISIINRIKENNFVYADRNTLETIVRNLLSNAIKFTRDCGTIEIDSIIKNGSIEVSITDNGIGIESENLEKLFKINQAFSTYGTKKESGSGLGLILCKEFVKKNNGILKIESAVGTGTKVKFTLPLAN